MEKFLSMDEVSLLKSLENLHPEGRHEIVLYPGARDELLKKKLVVRSDAGYFYCTAAGVKYLEDESAGRHVSAGIRFLKFFTRFFS